MWRLQVCLVIYGAYYSISFIVLLGKQDQLGFLDETDLSINIMVLTWYQKLLITEVNMDISLLMHIRLSIIIRRVNILELKKSTTMFF